MTAESGKQVRLLLKNNFHYNGKVIEENETHIIILDKFKQKISISKDSIAVSEEVKNDH